jgi:hypothetical protein
MTGTRIVSQIGLPWMSRSEDLQSDIRRIERSGVPQRPQGRDSLSLPPRIFVARKLNYAALARTLVQRRKRKGVRQPQRRTSFGSCASPRRRSGLQSEARPRRRRNRLRIGVLRLICARGPKPIEGVHSGTCWSGTIRTARHHCILVIVERIEAATAAMASALNCTLRAMTIDTP